MMAGARSTSAAIPCSRSSRWRWSRRRRPAKSSALGAGRPDGRVLGGWSRHASILSAMPHHAASPPLVVGGGPRVRQSSLLGSRVAATTRSGRVMSRASPMSVTGEARCARWSAVARMAVDQLATACRSSATVRRLLETRSTACASSVLTASSRLRACSIPGPSRRPQRLRLATSTPARAWASSRLSTRSVRSRWRRSVSGTTQGVAAVGRQGCREPPEVVAVGGVGVRGDGRRRRRGGRRRARRCKVTSAQWWARVSSISAMRSTRQPWAWSHAARAAAACSRRPMSASASPSACSARMRRRWAPASASSARAMSSRPPRRSRVSGPSRARSFSRWASPPTAQWCSSVARASASRARWRSARGSGGRVRENGGVLVAFGAEAAVEGPGVVVGGEGLGFGRGAWRRARPRPACAGRRGGWGGGRGRDGCSRCGWGAGRGIWPT